MGWLKYDKEHMDREALVKGKASPMPSGPFTLGGRRISDSFPRSRRALVATAKTAGWSIVMKLFLMFCHVARVVYPNPRFRRWVIVTKDADVREVLNNNQTFIVPYTPEMIELAGGTNSVLGMDDTEPTRTEPANSEHTKLRALIMRAMHEVKTETGVAMDALIRSQSADVANALLDNSAGRIDVMTDLITRTLTETTCTYFGLKVDDPVEFARWTMAVSWLLFGDPQGNPTVREEAMNAAPRLRLVIDQAILAAQVAAKEEKKAPATEKKNPQGLIRTMIDIQDDQKKKNAPAGEQLTDARIRATVIGLIVALIPTNTLAAGNMLKELLRRKGRPEWDKAISLANRMVTNEEERARATALIEAEEERSLERALLVGTDEKALREQLLEKRRERAREEATLREADEEALRNLLLEAGSLRPALSPGLWRYVNKRAVIAADGGWRRRRTVRPNDVVLAVIPTALRDPERERDGLSRMFGHGPHECLGAQLAMVQITQIFKALLARKPELATRRRKPASVGPFPVRLEMKFSPDRTQSTMIIITAPTASRYVRRYAGTKVENYKQTMKAIEDAIAKLENPATDEIRASLDKTGMIHFASISVVEANAEHSKPPIILIEVNADGPRDDVLRALVDEGFEWLMPIFSFVTDRVQNDRELLFELLRMHARELRCSPFDPLGLHFDGMRQFSVRNIDRQANLANFARRAVDEHLKMALDGTGRASEALNYAREKIRGDKRFSGDLLQPSRKVLDIAAWRPARSFVGPFFTSVWKTRSVRHAIELFLVTWIVLGLALHDISRVFVEGVAGEGAATQLVAHGWTLFAAVLGSFLATIFLTGVILLIFILLLGRHEKTDKSVDQQVDLESAKKIARLENRFGQTQNHIIAVMPLKRGWFRRLTLAFSLWGIKQSLFWFRPGFVVTMGTIHYAKWFVIPGTDRFVFMANYDGSWESYLEDFITRAHEGQSAAWGNGVGFPMTRWLIRYGAEDGDRFKRWVRNQQRPSLFWYCRFPDLSAEQIRKNALIQDGLARATTSTESRAWLNTFGSEQRQENEIEADEVQSLVFSGQPQSHFMTCILLQLPDHPETRVKWLRGLTGQPMDENPELPEKKELDWLEWNGDLKAHIMPSSSRVSFGDHHSPDGATFLALSATGLCQLGLPSEPGRQDGSGIDSFPPVFRMGMANRQNVLGDRGLSAPDKWLWSDASQTDDASKRPFEAALLIYGPSPESNDKAEVKKLLKDPEKSFESARNNHRAAVARQLEFLALCKGLRIRQMETEPDFAAWKVVETGPDFAAWKDACKEALASGGQFSPIEREHFGFRDGISQPVIRGTNKAASRPPERDMVAPGEFILGYRNNQDYFPPAFTIRASDDLQNKLPTISANTPLRFPHFGGYTTTSDDDRSAPNATDAMRDYRDFGRNGTFLVIRDLAQDVEGFKTFIEGQVKAVTDANNGYPYLPNIIGRAVDKDWVAAKMVGRWQDGSPLVGNAHRPPRRRNTPPDNDFAYGTDDPRGLQCPLGAHIRRTNPRDSLQPGDPQEQEITNRHRLIRRGRTYVNGGALVDELGKSDPKAKGMIFACICADLERQFEFVQQSWANSLCFHGLNKEPDPLISAMNAGEDGKSSAVFSIPTPGGAVMLKNMQSYVTTRAGGYFFMPSRSALLYLSSSLERDSGLLKL